MKCWKCDGTGTTKGWIQEPCAYCGGTGELPDDFSEMTKLKRCKKCGGEAVFSGVFDDPLTYRFPECMKCGARAEGNSVKDSWYERARKWNEQNTLTNEEWLKSLNTKQLAKWIDNLLMRCLCRDCNFCPIHKEPNCTCEGIEEWLKQPHTPIS